jgi:hypothetical protein
VFPVLNDWIHAAHSLTKTSTTVVHELREIGWRSKQKTRRLLAHGRTQHSEHQFRKSTPLELTAGECRKYLKHIRFYAVDGQIFGYRSSFHSRVRVADSHLQFCPDDSGVTSPVLSSTTVATST